MSEWPVREINSIVQAYQAKAFSWHEMRNMMRRVVGDCMEDDDDTVLEQMWDAQAEGVEYVSPGIWVPPEDRQPFTPLPPRPSVADEVATDEPDEED